LKEIELLIRKNTLKDVELCILQEKNIEIWLKEQYKEIDNKLKDLRK
jgi:hypothetical protein